MDFSQTAGGGATPGGLAVARLLCEIVVRHSFGVLKDLHGFS